MIKILRDISILTGICCILVVFIHISSEGVAEFDRNSFAFILFFISNKAATFVVPGFVFLSGFKLTNSYKTKEFKFIEFIKKRFSRVLIPYIFWFFTYYLLFLTLGFIEILNIKELINSFIFGRMVSPFYFIILILQFYLVFGVLNKFKKYRFIFSIIINILIFRYQFIYYDRFFLYYIFYFVLGMELADNKEFLDRAIKKYKYLIFTVYFITLGIYLYRYYIYTVDNVYFYHVYWELIFRSISIVFFYILALEISKINYKKLNLSIYYIDRASFYIYLSHCFYLYIFNHIWYSIGIISITNKFILNMLFVYFMSFFTSILYIILKDKFKRRNLKIIK